MSSAFKKNVMFSVRHIIKISFWYSFLLKPRICLQVNTVKIFVYRCSLFKCLAIDFSILFLLHFVRVFSSSHLFIWHGFSKLLEQLIQNASTVGFQWVRGGWVQTHSHYWHNLCLSTQFPVVRQRNAKYPRLL